MSRKKMRDLVGSWCVVVVVIVVLFVDPSVEQGSGSPVKSFRGSLLSSRGQTESEAEQQVILPRGFQPQQRIQTPSNVAPLGSYETRGISRVIPSIQNGHFQLRPRGASVPFGSDRNSGGFSPLLNLNPAGNGNSRSSQQTSAANEARYEYYDDNNDDIIYHYSNEDGTPESSSSSSGGSSSSSRGASNIPTKSVAASVRGSGSLTSRVISQPSPLIPLVDEDERGVILRGRSVQGQQSPRNSAFGPPHNPTPLPGLIRNPLIFPSKGLSSTVPPLPPVTTTRRPAILRGPVNRFTLSSRPSRPAFRPVETNPVVRKADISSTPLDSAGNRVSDSQKDNDSEGEYEYQEEEYYEEDEQESEDKAKVPETKTKVTVSVSTKTSSTTPAPSSTLGPGIVISVATTRSVSDRIPARTSTPAPVTTPKVTFSRATGSSIVVASVQTSRSVASPGPLAPLQRLINSQQAAQAKSNPEPEYVEEEYAYPDNYPVTNGTSLVDGQPTASSSKTVTQESVMDKLDYLQSELTNGLFTGLHSHASVPSTSTQNSVPLTSSTSTSESTTAAVSTPSGVSNQDTPGLNVEQLFKSIKFKEADLSHLLPPGYVPSSPPTTTTTTTTEATTTTTTTTTTTPPPPTTKSAGIVFETVNIGSLLPKGYKISLTQPIATTVAPISSTTEAEITTSTSTTPRGLESLLAKVKMSDISALLPPGYDESRFTSSTSPPSTSPANVESSTSGLEALVPNIKFDDVSKFLPPGFSASSKPAPVFTSTVATAATADPTTAKQGLNKLVFPTRPGGLKATRPPTTERPAPDTPTPLKVTIMKGPPTRKTTEFTGWPTPSTTPMPSTSSTSTTTESTTTTTTTTTPRSTTTPIPPKRSALSACSNQLCKMEAVLRVVGHRWKPEYSDINTDEWKHLERTVKRELDAAYRSSGLAQYYRSVEIEGFTRGSVIVDYFVLLENVTTNLTSADVRALFHASLPPSDFRHEDAENPEGDHRLLPADERLRLGRYTIDPKYTDFKVRNVTTETVGASASEALIPQWGIAVIVIGLASLLFVVVFGVTVLVNKHRNSKKKNTVSLTQEMLSEFNKSHTGYGVDNYGADDLYNMDDVWNDKHQPQHHHQNHMDRTFDRKPKRGSSSGKGSVNYNIYDSWKTEWNGQYFNGNGNYYGDSGYAPSRRRSDYDTNF